MKALSALVFILALTTASAQAAQAGPVVLMSTSHGDIRVELDRERAPETVDNFLRYVEEGHYDGTIFHRVISNFMIQGGGYTQDFQKKATHEPIRNEADNGLKNNRGTIAMARTADPHSATGQFFINVTNNDFLNHAAKTRRGWGYAVFGRVIEGMDTVDAIRNLPTGPKGPFPKDVPREQVVIESMQVMTPAD